VLERRIATGGMGDAWLARQVLTTGAGGVAVPLEPVVVKTMHAHYARDPAMVELFLSEARIAARLNHENVIHIFDVGKDATGPYIAMELVDGLTLLAATRRCWSLGLGIPIEVAVRICASAARGIAHAHAVGVIHRDISPDNIVVGKNDDVKVLDFGIAKIRGTEMTKHGEVKGKIPYMAPEQLDPRIELDGRCDLYALGVTLYWCLAGRRPFVADIDLHLMRAIVEDEPPPLGALNPSCAGPLEDIVMNLLEKSRDEREGDGVRLAERLLSVLPHAREAPVGAFIQSLTGEDDSITEHSVITTSTGAGVPAVPVKDAARFLAHLSSAAAVEGSVAGNETATPEAEHESVAGLGEPRTREDISPLPPRRPAKAPRSPLPLRGIAALAGIVLLLIVAALAGGEEVSDKPAPPPGPKRHLVVRDAAAEPEAPPGADGPGGQHGREGPDGPDGPDGQDGQDGQDGPEEPDGPDAPGGPNGAAGALARSTAGRSGPRAERATDRAQPAGQTVSLIAPHDLQWMTSAGKLVARGTATVKLPPDTTSLVAVEQLRGARTIMPVAARMDWFSLPRGTLDVRVQGPATRVKLGNEILGRPPLRPFSAVAGTYKLLVEVEGGRAARATVTVRPGEVSVVSIDAAAAK
jgi:eukaryotic-like serine/threonine-protein kinase